MYFDLAYADDPSEPGLYWAGFHDTKSAFGFNPLASEYPVAAAAGSGGGVSSILSTAAQSNILGMQVACIESVH
jgi:hypothetical protein